MAEGVANILLYRRRRGGASEPAFDYYVDSVNGNDGDAGTSPGSAFRSIAVAQAALSAGKSLGFARGSYWRETFTFQHANIRLGVYGDGAMPVLDGADVVATTWTQPDAGTYADVWSISWTRTGPVTTGSEYLGLWADGVRPRYAASLADLQANGGWFASTLLTATATVYIKSATNPNSSGVVYEITRRNHAFKGHSTPIGSAAPANQQIEGPFELKRCVGHYNAFAGGPGTSKKLFLRDGNIHHAVTEGSLTEDVVMTERSPATAPSLAVAHREVGTDFSHTFRRVLGLLAGGSDRANSGNDSTLYAHGSSPATMATVHAEECLSRGANLFGAVAADVAVHKSYCEDPYANSVSIGATTITAVVRHYLSRDTTSTPKNSGVGNIRRLSTLPELLVEHAAICVAGAAIQTVGGDVTVSHSAFVTTNIIPFTGVSGLLATPDIHRCIFQGGRSLNLMGTGYVGDYNVFCFYQSGQVAPQYQWNGNVYGGANMSEWQAATGQDLHSVFYKYADQVSGNGISFWKGVADGVNAGPADGDFRINPNAKLYRGSDGAAITGLFADGVTPITQAGPQEHWDYNLRTIVPGPPTRWPTLPVNIAEIRTYLEDPAAWDFYP